MIIYGELYSSKNSKQIFRKKNGQFFIAKSNAVLSTEKALIQQLVYKRQEFKNIAQGAEYPLKIRFKIYRKTHRRFDYVNIIQESLDCMVKAGWFPDDDADHIIPIFEPYEVDKNNPRVEIFVDKN